MNFSQRINSSKQKYSKFSIYSNDKVIICYLFVDGSWSLFSKIVIIIAFNKKRTEFRKIKIFKNQFYDNKQQKPLKSIMIEDPKVYSES